ncbi:MAG: hypothetical protein CVU57_09975 [Deltaproteobacteria bacterium HGW-Deltaproteobacteria-15]|nr:MAG: hypothetical protein CVU57_09975 [Deltaproteobacteria bacterium HGW-Deltaproteobacteria-15]
MKKISPILMSLIGVALFLMGGLWFLTKSNAESFLVGKVNGEGISRKEFAARVDRVMKSYGNPKGLLQGQQGDEALGRIRDEVLDEMIVEKFLLQGAKKAGFATAPEDEVARQVEEIKKMSGLSEPELENRLGLKLPDLKAEISDRWAISQYIEKDVLKDNPEDRELFFQKWLADSMQKAKIEKFANRIQTARASCCAPGGSCGTGKSPGAELDVEKDAREKGLEYYEKKTGKNGAEARVTDYGCHMQVDIVENGEVVLSLSYIQGVVQES